MKRKLLAIVTCLAVLLTLWPPSVAQAAEYISVGGNVLDGSGSKPAYATTSDGNVEIGGNEENYNIKWDGATLTLRNAVISFKGNVIERSSGNLEISLIGNNKITSTSESGTGIIVNNGDLTISEEVLGAKLEVTASFSGICSWNDTLTINSGTITSTSRIDASIYAFEAMSINGGTVTAISGNGGISTSETLTIGANATVMAITTDGNALNGGNGITINGGTVTANGGSSSAFSEVTEYINVVPPNGETIAVQYGENINNVQKSTYTEETDIMNTVENYSYFHSYLTNASEPTITGVIVQPETVTLQQGTQHTFAATVTGSGDLSQAKVSWSVSGSNSASAGTSISKNGQLTVATDEMAESLTVTASINDGDTTLSDTAIVTVTKVPVQSITIEPSEITLMAGQTYQLKATVVPPEAGVVTWTSDSSDRVSVDETGLITAHSWGTVSPTIIRATIGSASATCTVRVVSPDISVGGVDFYSDGTTAVYGITDQSGSVSTQGATEKNYNIKWDGSTLTLRNATIIRENGNGIEDESAGMDRLVIEGTNTITVTEQNSSGILDRGNLTISGSGSLDVTGSRWGLNVSRAVTIESGTIHAKGTSTFGDGIEFGGPMIINGGNVTADGGLYGIVRNGGSGAYGFTINGGIVQATGKYSGIFLYDGSSEGHVDINGGRIEVSGGTYGIYNHSGSIDISGGVVIASGTLQASSGVVISPTEGTAIAVMAGANAENATALEGSPFEKETNIDDLLSDIEYVHTEVIEPAPSITSHPQSITVTEGQQATFSVAATGNGLSYQWQQRTDGTDWENVDGATNATYTIDRTTTDMSGYQYRCIVTGLGGETISNAATLTVNERSYTGKYSYEIVSDVGENGTIEVDRYATEGDKVTITVSPDEAYLLDDLTVTSGGKDVELTDNGDGTYSFTMPSGNVAITATFAEDPNWEEPEDPATDVSEIFTDVPANHWAQVAIQYVYDNGLMTGVSDTAFAPEATTTRAMIVSMLARLENVTSAESAGFSDVADSDWYATAVNWAASEDIVGGFGDSTFQPNSPITREQMASILYRYAEYKGYDVSARVDLSAYSDQPSAWAEDVMQWAVAEGLLNGVTDDELQPQGQATRAQVAAILQRFLSE